MGFVDVEVERIQLPIGEWSRDNVDLGRWYRLGICEALEALSLAPFTRPQFSWPVDDAKRYVKEVQGILRRAEHPRLQFLVSPGFSFLCASALPPSPLLYFLLCCSIKGSGDSDD